MKNKTKKIIDIILYIGLFSICVVMGTSYMYKMIYGKPTLLPIIGVLVILIVATIAMIITTKIYGPYREKNETDLPLIFYFLLFWLLDFPLDYVYSKLDLIAETATDIRIGALQITAILTVLFMLLIVYIKAIAYLEKKYNQYKKAKNEQE